MDSSTMDAEGYRQAITEARRNLAAASTARVLAETTERKAQHQLDALLWRRPVVDQ